MIKFFDMKVLLTLLLFLLVSFSSAKSSADGDIGCLSIQKSMQTMSMDGEHTQCEGICVACMAIQSATPTLQYLTLVSTSSIFVDVYYYSLHEPVLTPPPTV